MANAFHAYSTNIFQVQKYSDLSQLIRLFIRLQENLDKFDKFRDKTYGLAFKNHQFYRARFIDPSML